MVCLFETTAIERHQKHLQLLSFINSTLNIIVKKLKSKVFSTAL